MSAVRSLFGWGHDSRPDHTHIAPPTHNRTTHTLQQDPWFSAELPPNALAMNDKYMALPPACEQTEGQIRAVVAAVCN